MNDEQLVVECVFVCGTFYKKAVCGELTATFICGEQRWVAPIPAYF